MKPSYRLRWRFDFLNSPSKIGCWNGSSPHFSDSATSVKKEGLVRACIEGEHLQQYATKVLFEMPGHEYKTSQWIRRCNAAPVLSPKVNGEIKLQSELMGLALISDTHKYTVYVDGTGSVHELPIERRNIKLLEHTAGS